MAAAFSLLALSLGGAAPALALTPVTPIVAPAGSGTASTDTVTPDPAGPAVPAPGSADISADGPTKQVSYDGVTVDVPTQMPVVNLDDHPGTCVRYDRAVVYVGAPDQEQNCPARAIGRSDAVWIGPETPEVIAEVEGTATTQAQGTTKQDDTSTAERRRTVVVPEREVAVRTTWRTDAAAMNEVAASVALDTATTQPSPADAVSPALTTTTTATTPNAVLAAGSVAAAVPAAQRFSTAVAPAAAPAAGPAVQPAIQPALSQAVSGAPGVFTGMAFDTCAAPTASTMQKWRASPYSAVGIYIGGALRACGDGNLSASWIDQVAAQGWGFIPIYVGLQAPCVGQSGLATMSRDLGTARSQGAEAARDAVSDAQRFGLGANSTLYFDMEAYSMTDSGCSSAAVAFMQSWTVTLHDAGFRSGVYGGVGSMMRDLTKAVQGGGYQAPDAIWLAHWNNLQTTRDTMSPQYVPDNLWSGHQRIRQYQGDHSESWGGVGLNIDSNWVDAELPGNATPTGYGQNATGPGGAGFVFTGSMAYWRASPGSGTQGRAYWTRPSGTSAESNGATWEVSLTPGTYAVDANVPSTSGAGVARYTLSGAGTSTVATLDQARASGWQEVGVMTVGSDGRAQVHLGDNGTTDTSRTLWADAVRWRLVSSGPDPTPVGWTRIAGADLYDTSAAIAKAGFASASEAFVATGQDYPDAAAGGAMAGIRRAPMLLTRGGDLPPVIADQLRRLRPATTYVLGGPLAVSDAVVSQITAATGGQVVRLSGQSQYDTAAAVARQFRPNARTAYLATGLNFPDAISGGAAAAREDAPMVLSGHGALEPATRTFLQTAQPTKVVVLGGPVALPAAVVDEVRALVPGVQVVRYSGTDQYDTAAQVTRAVFGGQSRPALGYATGANYPDALSGTPLMAKLGGGMLLTTASCHPGVTADATAALNPSARYVLGGTLVAYAGETRC